MKELLARCATLEGIRESGNGSSGKVEQEEAVKTTFKSTIAEELVQPTKKPLNDQETNKRSAKEAEPMDQDRLTKRPKVSHRKECHVWPEKDVDVDTISHTPFYFF